VDLQSLDALLAPEGQRLLAELAGEDLSAGGELALQARLRRSYPAALVAAAVELAQLRLRARAKFARAGEMYFTRGGLEQASSEVVAAHRARRYAPYRSIADLCCGIGGDLVQLARGRTALGVDRDPLHTRIAGLNAAVLGTDAVEIRCADAREADVSGVEAAFVDPARRRGGKRELRPEESEPPLGWCLSLAERVPAVGIKAAPGLPRGLVPRGWELEMVSIHRELKEAALWSPALATAPRRATLLPEGQTLLPLPGEDVRVGAPGAYLLDPDPAVTRAGLVEDLARGLGAWKLDAELAFLSADAAVATPFARPLRIDESLPWGEKALRAALRRLDVGAVQIRKRGSAVDTEALGRRLKLSGSRRATVVLTRLRGRPWALICSEP
jgi:SAM-dependent methyltransferase